MGHMRAIGGWPFAVGLRLRARANTAHSHQPSVQVHSALYTPLHKRDVGDRI
jgi:hypothetical protein